jgi:excisionase family DNA binding protein
LGGVDVFEGLRGVIRTIFRRGGMKQKLKPETLEARTEDSPPLVDRKGLAVALNVSVHTVDRMVKNGQIPCVRPGGWAVRFCLGDVVEALRRGDGKFGRRAAVDAGTRRGGDAERGQAR